MKSANRLFWSLVGVLSVSAVLQWQLRANAMAAPPVSIDPLPEGATLPSVDLHVFARTTDGEFVARERATVIEVARGACQVLVFYHSDCPGAEDMAPYWGGIRAIRANGVTLPVRWITMLPDDNLNSCSSQHDLPVPLYAVPSLENLAAFGVNVWPLVYTVSGNGVILEKSAWRPEDVTGNPEICATDSVSAGTGSAS